MKTLQERHKVTFIYLALAIAILAAFWQLSDCEFITTFDDDLYVTKNPMVNTGFSTKGILWAFTKAHAYNWHPVTWISHMADCQLYGLDPAGHHITNLLLHIANALLLLTVLRQATGNLWASAFVAAAFALHPMHVESVAWVSERKDVLSTFFWYLTILSYLWYVRRPTLSRYIITILLFALGLMSKQMLVTLPLALLLLDYWPLRRFTLEKSGTNLSQIRRCTLEKVPLLLLSIAASITVYLVQQQTGVMKDIIEVSFLCRTKNAFVSYTTYAMQMFWPVRLAIFYPLRCHTLSALKVAGTAAVLLAITTLAVSFVRRKPYLAVGWFWFLGTLVPVIGLVQVGNQAHADRYTYIPHTGLLIMIAWTAAEYFTALRYRRIILSVSAIVLLTAMAVATNRQVRYWRNDVTLHSHAVEAVPRNWWAHEQLGIALGEREKLDQAETHFNISLQIYPEYDRAHYNLAVVLYKQKRFAAAMDHFNQAIRIKPDYLNAHIGLGTVMLNIGGVDQAADHFKKTLDLKPDSPKLHNSLGLALAMQNKFDEAIESFNEAIKYGPDYIEARLNLAKAYEQLGMIDGALEQYKQILRIDPHNKHATRKLEHIQNLKKSDGN